MLSGLIKKIKLLKQIEVFTFIQLNYLNRNVIRKDRSKIIPYKNSVIDLEPNSKIYLENGDIEVGCDLLKKSKSETRIRLREFGVWNSKGGCKISYGTTLEILSNAEFTTNFFTVNSNSTIVVAKSINFGEDIMIGRNVTIYDSDFHEILDEDENITNKPKEVSVGDHVWIATNSIILKGSKIGSNTIIGANSIIHGIIPDNCKCYTQRITITKDITGSWNRRSFNNKE